MLSRLLRLLTRRLNVAPLFSRHEAHEVAETTGGTVLEGVRATPADVKCAMRTARYIHFACHGLPDAQAALDSGMLLAPDGSESNEQKHPHTLLTLGEIIRDVRLMETQLVVLSACETGLVAVEDRHDEYFGLPAGFLCAGARQ